MTDFAEKVGKNPSYISMIERGRIAPPYQFLIACMETYGLQGAERVEFLVKAFACSPKLAIPLNGVKIIPPERYWQLLACLLLNYEPPSSAGREWAGIRSCLRDLQK